jgi:EmrB/QacA subfamily drug resistance transporter
MRRPTTILGIVVCTAFLTMLDNTVVTVAAPSIARDLHTPLPVLEWVATAYMLTFAGLLLAGGRLADRHGHRRVLMVGLALFTAASLAAGLAQDVGMLIAARAVQGTGAGLLVPATLAVIAGGDERDRMRGAAVWTASGAVALAAGPVLGGALSQHAHWSWIFLLNVPVGLAALAVVRLGLPDRAQPGCDSLDLGGLVTSTLALLAAMYALSLDARAWVLAVGFTLAFVHIERRVPAPMIDLELFRDRAVAGGIGVQALWGLGVNSVYFFTSIYLQDVRGHSPTGAGLALLPTAVALAVGAGFAPGLVRRWGAARAVAGGLALVALGIAGVAFTASLGAFLVAAGIIGFGSALTVPLGAVVLGAAPPGRAGVAGGAFAVAREASGVLGIAGIGVIVVGGGYRVGLAAAAVVVLGGALVSLRTLPGRRLALSPEPVLAAEPQ